MMTDLNYATRLTPRVRRMIAAQAKIEVDTVTEIQINASASGIRPRGAVKVHTINRIMSGASPESLPDIELVKIAEALRIVRVNNGLVSVAAPTSANLISSSVKSRLLTAGRAFFCGDSISSNAVAGARFPQAAMKTWNANWAGIYIAHQLSSAGTIDGLQSLTTTVTNTSFDNPDADDWDTGAGGTPETKFDWPNAFIPNGRHERIWSATGAANQQIHNSVSLIDEIKSGGAFPWVNSTWMIGKTMKAAGIWAQHALGVPVVNLRGRLNGSVGARVAADTEDATTKIIRIGPATIGTPDAAWTDMGLFYEADTVASGDGTVEFYTHIYSDEDDDTGVHLGSVAQAGLTAADWIDSARYNATHMAEFIEATKADTFILALGMNDSGSVPVISKAQYKADMEAVISAIRTAHATAQGNDATIRDAKFCLIGMYEGQADRSETLADYADALFEISSADSSNIGFINLYRASGPWESLDGDSFLGGGTDVHPTVAGAAHFMDLMNTELQNA